MADITATVSDSTYIKIIEAAVENPITIAFFIILLALLYMIYKRPKEIWSIFKTTFTFRFLMRHKTLTKADLVKHQFFRDIQFFLDYKIDNLYNSESFQNYDKAKLSMAHDLLMIKIKDVKKWVEDFIIKTNFDDPYISIRSVLKNKIDKHRAIVWTAYKEIGIPDLFIEKFLEVSKMHEEYATSVLDDLLSDKIPLTIYERLFLVLGCLNQYYSTLVIKMKDVVESINGDLKGLVYKEHIIGGNDYRCYPVPTREYIPIVESKLQELSTATKAKRVAVYYIHDYIGDEYLQGYVSKLYEYTTKGLKPLVLKCQYKPAMLLSDILPIFKQHQGTVNDSTHFNEVLSKMLIDNGIVGAAMYPIFLHDSLKGFAALEYNSIETFETLDKEEILRIMKKFCSMINIYLDYSKTGFSYAGNEAKE